LFSKAINAVRRIRELVRELRGVREERDQAQREKARLEQENQRLREEIDKLKKELEAVQRAARRQAAPFSRGKRKKNAKAPGRKPGAKYGKQYNRPIPDHVDEEISVAAPEKCPRCGGPLTIERMEEQYQEEIIRRTKVRRFHIPICRCACCEQRVQGGTRCKPPMRWGRQRCKWGQRR